MTEAEKDAAFDKLHAVYAPRALQDILEMRGLYIKLVRRRDAGLQRKQFVFFFFVCCL